MQRLKKTWQWVAVSPLLLLALIVVIINWIIHNLGMIEYTYLKKSGFGGSAIASESSSSRYIQAYRDYG